MYKTVVVFQVKNYFYVLTRKTIFVWIVRSVWTYPGCPYLCQGLFTPDRGSFSLQRRFSPTLQLFRERLSEKMCTRKSQKVIWDISDTVAVEPTFVAFFSTGKHKFIASLAFFQISLKSRAQNYPQYLSGLSRALFSDNLSRNSCILRASIFKSTNLQSGLCV